MARTPHPSAQTGEQTEALPPRVVGAYAQAFWDYGAQRELPLALWQQEMHIQAGDDLAPEQYLQLLNAAVAHSGDPLFGLKLGQQLRLSHYAVYGLGLLAARHLGEAVNLVIRFESLAHDLGRSSLLIEDELAIYRWRSAWLNRCSCPVLVDSVFAGIAVFVRWLMQENVQPLRVHLCRSAPQDRAAYEQLFAAPVLFEAAENEIVFPADLLQRRLPNADPAMQSAMIAHAEKLLQARSAAPEEAGLLEIRRHIAALLWQGEISLSALAETMGRSPRGLQRDLEQMGSGFQRLLDETRQQLALEYLQDKSLGLTEIALRLGYSEHSSFTHAFKQWEGLSPKQWRLLQAKN